MPFEDDNTAKLYKKILQAEYRIPQFVSNTAKDLIRKMLEVDTQQRINIEDIKKHPWFTAQKFKENMSQSPELVKEIILRLEKVGIDRNSVEDALKNNIIGHVNACFYLMLQKYSNSTKSPSSYSFGIRSVKKALPLKKNLSFNSPSVLNKKSSRNQDHSTVKKETSILHNSKSLSSPINSIPSGNQGSTTIKKEESTLSNSKSSPSPLNNLSNRNQDYTTIASKSPLLYNSKSSSSPLDKLSNRKQAYTSVPKEVSTLYNSKSSPSPLFNEKPSKINIKKEPSLNKGSYPKEVPTLYNSKSSPSPLFNEKPSKINIKKEPSLHKGPYHAQNLTLMQINLLLTRIRSLLLKYKIEFIQNSYKYSCKLEKESFIITIHRLVGSLKIYLVLISETCPAEISASLINIL